MEVYIYILLIILLIFYIYSTYLLNISFIKDIESIVTQNYSKVAKNDSDIMIKAVNKFYFIIKPIHISKFKAYILYGITSSCDSFNTRMAIRRTIMKYSRIYKSKAFFFIGKSLNNKYNILLKKESRLYNDIIQISFYESYFNLTILSLYMIRWTTINCRFIYFIKNDQDVVPNIKLLYYYLKSIVNSNCSYGIVSSREKANRNKSLKKYIPYSAYNKNYLPRYIYGFFAIYYYKMLREINQISFSTYPIIYKEDVHIGLLATKRKYSFCRMKYKVIDIKSLNLDIINNPQKHIIAIHGVNFDYLKYFSFINK